MRTLMPFLTFCGEQHGMAEAAIELYCSVADRFGVTGQLNLAHPH